MIAAALEAEVEFYVERFRGVRGDDGRAAVVRNGRGKPRQVTLGSGTVTIEAPALRSPHFLERIEAKLALRVAREKAGSKRPKLVALAKSAKGRGKAS